MITVWIWFCLIVLILCTVVIAYLSLVVMQVGWHDALDADWEEERGK